MSSSSVFQTKIDPNQNIEKNVSMNSQPIVIAEQCFKSKEGWYNSIKMFVEKFPKARMFSEMQEVIDKYNASEINKQALANVLLPMHVRAQGKEQLFKWYILRFEHVKEERARWNREITRLEKQRRDLEMNPDIDTARKLLESLNKGRSVYRMEKQRIQELRDKLARKYKEDLKKLKIMDEKCENKNKLSIDFYNLMDSQYEAIEDEANLKWTMMNDDTRERHYLNDYEKFIQDSREEGILKWILTMRNDKYVKYCAQTHISGIRPKDTSEFEAELRTMIMENNLEFLNGRTLEEIIDSFSQ